MEKAIKLQAELEIDLNMLGEISDPVKKCSASLLAIEHRIQELFKYVSSVEFTTIDDEVNFFKNISPYFLAKFFYYEKMLNIEVLRRFSTSENIRAEIKKELDSIDRFVNCHADFIADYYSESRGRSVEVFTRGKNPDNWLRNDFAADIPRNFSIPTTQIATLISNEEVREYLKRVANELEGYADLEMPFSVSDYAWVGASKAAAWELLNKLAEKKILYYKGAPADKKKVAEFARHALKLNLGNIYEVDRKNRVRKKDRYPFIRSLLDDSGPLGENSATE